MSRLLGLAIGLLGASFALAQSAPPQSTPNEVIGQQPAAPAAPHVAEIPDPSLTAQQLEGRGDELRGERLYGDAIDFYQAALKKDPKRAMLWNKIGLAELRLARYDNARKAFDKAIKLDRNFSDAVGNLGATYYLQGVSYHHQNEDRKAESEYGKAVKTCNKAIKMRPDVASFHNNLANAYFAKKEFDNAVREFARAIQLDPDILERRSSTGIQAQVIGSEDRARYSFELARVYALSGNFDRALHYLRKAMEDGYPEMNSVYKEQEFAELRKDPRFTELMAVRPQALPQ
jgi:tetratricopeptide (TPR) repeat protein